jgi:hypothetical protein
MRLWSIARYDLSLSSEEFYSITPRQLDALIKRRERETQEREFMLAQLTSYLINFSMCRPKKAVSPRDFMPSEWAKTPPKPKRVRMTKKRRAEVAAKIARLFGA